MCEGQRRKIGRQPIRAGVMAIDDQTAIKVVDGESEVISDGHCKQFTPC